MIEKRICEVFYCKAPYKIDTEKEEDFLYCPMCREKHNEELNVDAFVFTNASRDKNSDSDDGSFGFNHKINYSINR